MIKIIGGEKKGTLIEVPKDNSVRPTSAIKRDSVFNILNSYFLKKGFNEIFKDKIIMYIFSGTGALGLEAISRGAKYCYFIEKNKNCIKILTNNCKKIAQKNNYLIINNFFERVDLNYYNIINYINIVFMDPPYNFIDFENILDKLHNSKILSNKAILIIETDCSTNIPKKKYLNNFDIRTFGRTKISFFEFIGKNL